MSPRVGIILPRDGAKVGPYPIAARGCSLHGRNLLSRVTELGRPYAGENIIDVAQKDRARQERPLLSLPLPLSLFLVLSRFLSCSLNYSAYHPVAAIAAISNECPALWADRAADSGPRVRAPVDYALARASGKRI